MGRARSGLASLVGRLASFFRLNNLGFAEPGSEQPARSRLRTVEDVAAQLRAERLLPSSGPPTIMVWSYLCKWYDRETGQPVGRGVAWTVETDIGTDYRAAAAEARRRTLYPTSPDMSRPPTTPAGVYLRCQRLGQPYEI